MMKSKSGQFPAIVSALILFYLAEPYFMWGSTFGSIYMRTILAFIMGFCFFQHKKRLSRLERILFILMLGTIIMYPIIGGYNVNFLISILPVVLLPFASESFSKDVYNHFLTIFAIVAAFGLFFWLFAMVGAIGPIRSIPPLNPLKTSDYYVYPFFISSTGEALTRFEGVFDEPGVMGTLCGIMLCIGKMNFKNWRSIIILLAGLASLSLFFYVIIAIYYLIYLAFEKKSFVRLFSLILLLVGAFFVIQNVPVLQENIGERLEWNSDKGGFSGDNRINSDVVYYYFASAAASGQLMFGIQNKEAYMADTEGSSSFLSVIILYGVVFSLLYIGIFLLYAHYYRKNWISFLLFTIVFLGVIYQRPNIFQFVYVFLFSYFARIDRIEQLSSPNNPIKASHA